MAGDSAWNMGDGIEAPPDERVTDSLGPPRHISTLPFSKANELIILEPLKYHFLVLLLER